jgi:hypothetical protein
MYFMAAWLTLRFKESVLAEPNNNGYVIGNGVTLLLFFMLRLAKGYGLRGTLSKPELIELA